MTQEEKQLLIKDLCARLPYGVKFESYDNIPIVEYCVCDNVFIHEQGYIIIELLDKDSNGNTLASTSINLSIVSRLPKPYLRPIKSMTLEECDKLFKILDIREDSGEWLKINDIGVMRLFSENGKDFYEIAEAMDYLYSIHVDFRDLIPIGLALEAPEGMY